MFAHLNPLKWRTSTKALWISFLLPVIIMTIYFGFRGMAPFGSSSILTVDLGQQYIDFFESYRHALFSDPLSIFYSFAKGLGGETYGDWAYYLLSPTNLLLLPFSNTYLPIGILFLTILKYGLAGWSFAYALKSMRWQNGWRLPLFSVTYAMMGWFVANDLNLLWLDAAILLPLIIAGLERYIEGRSAWRFIAPLFAIFVINYYMAYMIGLFLVLYIIWRLFWQPYRLLKRWHILRKFIFGSIISIGLSTVIWLPTAYTLLNSKGQHMLDNLSWKFEYQAPDLLGKLFLGTFNFDQMPSGLPNIFVGSLPIIMLWFFFTYRLIRWQTRLVAFFITAFLVVSMMYAPLNLMWHGFQFPVWYPYRFSYVFSFWVIWLAASVWSPTLRFSWTQLGSLFILAVAAVVYLYYRLDSLNFLTKNQLIIGGSFFLLLLGFHALPVRSGWWLPMVTLLVVGEMTTSTIWSLNNFSYLTNTEYTTYIKSLNQITADLPKSDKDFYRVAQSFQRTKGDPLQAHYNGASTFSSALEHQQSDFMAAIGQPEGDNYITYNGGTLVSDALLGMRYLIQPSGQEPHTSGTPTNMRTYSRSDTNGYYQMTKHTQMAVLSKNPYALPLAFAANTNALNVKFKDNDPLRNQSDLWNALLGYDNTPIFESANFDSSAATNMTAPTTITGAFLKKENSNAVGSLTVTYTPSTDDPYYLTIGDALNNDNVEIQLNGKALPTMPSHRHTIIVPLPSYQKGQTQTITFILKKNDLWLQNVSLYRANTDSIRAQAQTLQHNAFKPSHVSQTRISGKITIPAGNGLMMTTIPAANGWTAYVDGKETDTVTVGKFFIGLALKPGEHSVTFKFTPPYLKISAIVSLGFALFMAGLGWSESEKRRHSLHQF